MNSELRGAVFRKLRESGWAWISNTTEIDLDKLANELGTVTSSRSGGERSKILQPYTTGTAPENSMSSIIGTNRQPMHTDCAYFPLPPRYLILRCVSPGESECPTFVWVVDWNRINARRCAEMFRPGWVVRGGGYRKPFYVSVVNHSWNGEQFMRFDPCCMTPPQSGDVMAVTRALEADSCSYEFKWQPGSILIVDNWRCLHARGAGSDLAPGRRLERWLIGGGHGVVGRSSQ